MTPTTKRILRNSIEAFKSTESKDKESYILSVQKNLKDQENASDSTYNNVIHAGKVFLRIFNTNKDEKI